MASIQEYLDLIKNAIYGKDVRQAIYDGIQQCYYDGKAGSTDLEARQRLDTAEGSISSLGSRMSTAENDIDVLDSRVDEIVAPSGQAPSAAEVTDARVGANGQTYTSLGGAIRGQVTDLTSDLSEFENDGKIILRSKIIQNSYPNASGGFDSYNLWDRTDYIEINGNQPICFMNPANTNDNAWYDSSKQIISKFTIPAGSPAIVTSPANAKYMVASNYRTSFFSAIYVMQSYYATKDELQTTETKLQMTTNAETKISISNSVLNKNRFNGFYIRDYRLNESGVIIPTDSLWDTTDYIYVGDLESIVVSGKLISSDEAVLMPPYFMCAYDNNLQFVEYVGTTPPETYTVPDNVSFIRFCYHYNLYTEVQVESGTTRTSYTPFDFEAIAKATDSTLRGKKVTVIGDSITEHNSTATRNWTSFLEEETGCIVQNLGVSGTGFYYSSPYKNRLSQIDSDTDIIGIAISFNDIGKGVSIGTFQDTIETTLCGYAYVCLTTLQSMFPSTPIIVYSQGPWSAYYRGGNLGSGTDYITELKKLCNNLGIPVYDELYMNGCALRPWNADNQDVYYKNETTGVLDNTHPNSKGHKIIANYLIPKFEQNICNV